MNDSVVQFALGQPNVQFECKARGIPVPAMEWYKVLYYKKQFLYQKIINYIKAIIIKLILYI